MFLRELSAKSAMTSKTICIEDLSVIKLTSDRIYQLRVILCLVGIQSNI